MSQPKNHDGSLVNLESKKGVFVNLESIKGV